MVNLLVFNLLIGIALLASSMAPPDSPMARYKWLAVSAPLVLSLAVITFTWFRASRGAASLPWLVAAHWKLCASRYRPLLIAYAICGAILSLALFGGQGDVTRVDDRMRSLPPAMQEMERRKLESQDMGSAVWARIAVVPLLLMIMTTIMLESGALAQAGRGEVPDAIAKAFPPPDDLPRSESQPRSDANGI